MGAVDTTYTFTATDTITSSKMNNIIDQTTMTTDSIFGTTLEVVSGKLKVRSQGITSNELATGSVTTNAITDLNVTTGKIADLGVTTGKIADANVTTVKILDANITATKLDGAQTGTAPIYGVRAWCSFDADRNAAGGTDSANTARYLYCSGNITSVVKTSTGNFTITMTTALPTTGYAVLGSCNDPSAVNGFASIPSSHTTTSFQILTENTGGAADDFRSNSIVVIG